MCGFQRWLAEGEHGAQELSGGELDGVWLGGDVPITSRGWCLQAGCRKGPDWAVGRRAQARGSVSLVHLKNIHSLTVESYVLFGGNF